MKDKKQMPKHLENYIPNLGYYNRLKKLVEAFETRRASNRIKENIRKEQDRLNRQHEYNRIIGELSKSSYPFVNKKSLEDRAKQLNKLGAKSVGTKFESDMGIN
jgi:uncharacterized membrane protein YheB (UPF0754 family)